MKLTRREFLEASAAAATSLPLVSRCGEIVMSANEQTYAIHHNWLTPPSNLLFGDTHGLAQDSRGRIYVAHTVRSGSESSDAIAVFDEKGKFVNSWGSDFKGGAHGLDLRKEGGEEFLYHCDTGRRLVVKTKLDGTVVWQKGAPAESDKYKNGEAFIPTNVAFAPDGSFYVADGYGSAWIHHFDLKGEFIRTFGGPGTEPGRVNNPHGLWLDDRGKEPFLVVADRGNRRMQYFSLDGKHVRFDGSGMRLPCHFDIQNGVMVCPDLESVVTLLDPDNKVIAQLGDGRPTNLRGKPESEFINGKFIHPHDAMFLRNGDILVAEWVPQGRITLLKKG